MREKIKAAATFVLAWLSTPSSKVGIVAMLTAFAGNRLAPHVIEGAYYGILVLSGVGLILWPQKPQ